jgi:gamma-glutamylcyclotransferase
MSRRRIEERLGPCRALGAACLKGYQLNFHKCGGDGSGKCTIQHTGDGRQHVLGGLFDLSQAQSRQLDGFEGSGYFRQRVGLYLRGQSFNAYTYIAVARYIDNSLIPFDWYRALVLQGARELEFARSYIHKIRSLPYNVDPDPSRRENNFQIVQGQ